MLELKFLITPKSSSVLKLELHFESHDYSVPRVGDWAEYRFGFSLPRPSNWRSLRGYWSKFKVANSHSDMRCGLLGFYANWRQGHYDFQDD